MTFITKMDLRQTVDCDTASQFTYTTAYLHINKLVSASITYGAQVLTLMKNPGLKQYVPANYQLISTSTLCPKSLNDGCQSV